MRMTTAARTALSAAALCASLGACANSPMAVSSSYTGTIEPRLFRVDIPRSYLKTMRVYVHPSLTRAFVAPVQREATAESLSMGIAGWSARAPQLVPAYEAALQAALKERGAACTASSPVAFADVLGFEFTLTCR